jgi:hypothetical protein
MIVMREQLSVKQRQAISEPPAKGGGGGLVETCFSSLGRMAAFPGKRPWLGSCLQGLALIECNLKRDLDRLRYGRLRI